MLDYQSLATNFRNMIERARNERRFPIRDRMSGFPRGCCDDATDLFAHHLWIKYGLKSVRVDGSYYDDDPEKNIWHTWLEIDGIIVDLTSDQFPKYKNIYVGKEDDFHSMFEVKRQEYVGYLSHSDSCWERMNMHYKAIVDIDL